MLGSQSRVLGRYPGPMHFAQHLRVAAAVVVTANLADHAACAAPRPALLGATDSDSLSAALSDARQEATQRIGDGTRGVGGPAVGSIDASGPIPYRRDGVLAWNVGPPTPFFWPPNASGELMVFECARYCHANGTYWPPDPATGRLVPFSNGSYFRIRRMATGEVVGNVQESEGYAYGSAVVDPVTGTAWVFGSPRNLCHPHGGAAAAGQATHLRRGGGGDVNGGGSNSGIDGNGAAQDGGPPLGLNFVRAWWSNDLVTWHTAEAPAIGPDMLDKFPFNTDVASVTASSDALAAAGLPRDLNFAMVLESGRVAFHVGPSRNLSTGWVPAGNGPKVTPTSGFGPCPSIHHATETGHFYVVSGGRVIALSRTRDFYTWEHAAQPLVKPSPFGGDAALSPWMGVGKQASSGTEDGATLKRVLAHPECWEMDVNDADFCCQRDSGAPTDAAWVLYSPSSQGQPPLKNCSSYRLASTDFNAVATANVSLTALLQSRFPPSK